MAALLLGWMVATATGVCTRERDGPHLCVCVLAGGLTMAHRRSSLPRTYKRDAVLCCCCVWQCRRLSGSSVQFSAVQLQADWILRLIAPANPLLIQARQPSGAMLRACWVLASMRVLTRAQQVAVGGGSPRPRGAETGRRGARWIYRQRQCRWQAPLAAPSPWPTAPPPPPPPPARRRNLYCISPPTPASLKRQRTLLHTVSACKHMHARVTDVW